MAAMYNEAFAWVWICLGLLSGAVIGVGFQRDDHLGGYDGWKRRMLRLGHIAFFGTGILNFMFFWSHMQLDIASDWVGYAGILLMVGAVLMPLTCFVSAFWKRASSMFFLPVLALTGGCVIVAAGRLQAVLG